MEAEFSIGFARDAPIPGTHFARHVHRPRQRCGGAGVGPVGSVSKSGQPGAGGGFRRRRGRFAPVPDRLCRQAGENLRPRPRGRDRGIRADRGDSRPDHVLCPAVVRRRQHRPGARQVLPDGQRAGDRDQQPPDLLHARAEPAGRRGDRGQVGRSGTGATISARSVRTSSPTIWKSCCTRKRSRAGPPGAGCSTRRSPACGCRSVPRN